MKPQLLIFGLQRTCTNLVEHFVTQKFGGEIANRESEWKHGLPPSVERTNEAFLALGVRDPYSWLWSSYRMLKNGFGKDPAMGFQLPVGMGFQQYLRSNSYGFQNPARRWNVFNEVMISRCQQNPRSTIFRTETFADRARAKWEIESLGLMLTGKMTEIDPADLDQKFGTKAQKVDQPAPRARMSSNSHMANFTHDDLKFVNSALDPKILNHLGYEVQSTAPPEG